MIRAIDVIAEFPDCRRNPWGLPDDGCTSLAAVLTEMHVQVIAFAQ